MTRYHIACVAVSLAASIWLVHGSTIAHKFSETHWEDNIFFQHNEAEVTSALECLKPNVLLPGLYRPLSTTCYFYVGRHLFQNSAEGYHGINLFLILVNGLLVYLIAQCFLPRRWSILAALLFVTRLAHSEVLTNTVEFQVLSSVFFSLLAILFFLRFDDDHWPPSRIAGCLALLLCAILCKETAIVVPMILATYLFCVRKSDNLKTYLFLIGLPILWAGTYLGFYKSYISSSPTGFGYNVSPAHLLTQSAGHFFDFSNLLIWDQKYAPFSENVRNLIQHPATLTFFALMLLAATGLLLASIKWKDTSHHAIRLFIFSFCAWLIATGPFLILQDRLFMRYSYFGHAWLSIFWVVALRLVIQYTRKRFRPQADGSSHEIDHHATGHTTV